MRSPTTLALAVLIVLSGRAANADPYTILPDGSVAFNTVLTSQGTFTCLSTVPCTGSRTSSVTIGSGANTATLTFSGVNVAFQTENIAKSVTVGTIQASAADGFTFPRRVNHWQPIVRFDLSMTHSSPTATTRRKSIYFGPDGSTLQLLIANNSSMVFPTGPNPPGANYTNIIYTFSPFPFSIPSQGTTSLSTKVGAAPEPSTLILLGTGLAWGAYARRRKRLSRDC